MTGVPVTLGEWSSVENMPKITFKSLLLSRMALLKEYFIVGFR